MDHLSTFIPEAQHYIFEPIEGTIIGPGERQVQIMADLIGVITRPQIIIELPVPCGRDWYHAVAVLSPAQGRLDVSVVRKEKGGRRGNQAWPALSGKGQVTYAPLVRAP